MRARKFEHNTVMQAKLTFASKLKQMLHPVSAFPRLDILQEYSLFLLEEQPKLIDHIETSCGEIFPRPLGLDAICNRYQISPECALFTSYLHALVFSLTSEQIWRDTNRSFLYLRPEFTRNHKDNSICLKPHTGWGDWNNNFTPAC